VRVPSPARSFLFQANTLLMLEQADGDEFTGKTRLSRDGAKDKVAFLPNTPQKEKVILAL
jgi:hypothetical protein